MTSNVKTQLILAAVDALVNKGLPAAAHLLTELSKKDIVTIKDIEAVKGELDSIKYFE